MEYIITILTLICMFFLYFVYNLLRKVEIYEDNISNYEEIIGKQQEYIVKLSEIVVNSRDLIAKVDEKGVFEADDDIGEFFKFLKEIQETLNKFIINK